MEKIIGRKRRRSQRVAGPSDPEVSVISVPGPQVTIGLQTMNDSSDRSKDRPIYGLSFIEKVQRTVWPKESKGAPTQSFQPTCKEITLTQWIFRRMRRLIFFQKKKDPELEELEYAPLRYRPAPIEQLSEVTKFSKKELKIMYRGFKQECPTGVISEETFKEIYGKFFPLGNLVEDGSGRNTAMYAHYIFGTMDQDGVGHITFGDFIMGLSVLLKGSLQERINWIFNLYDINNDGYITKEELIDIVTSVYDLLGEESHPSVDDSTAVEHVENIFEKLDLNKDGVVTIDEFMEFCSKDDLLVSSLNIFGST